MQANRGGKKKEEPTSPSKSSYLPIENITRQGIKIGPGSMKLFDEWKEKHKPYRNLTRSEIFLQSSGILHKSERCTEYIQLSTLKDSQTNDSIPMTST